MTAALDKQVDQGAAPQPWPALPPAIDRALGPVILVVLVVNGLITLALEVLYLPTYLGSVAFPLSAALAGVVNVLLVLGASVASPRTGALFLPLIAWTLGFLACTMSGPGGDIMLGSDWRTLLLLICGLVPPLGYIYYRVNAGLFNSR